MEEFTFKHLSLEDLQENELEIIKFNQEAGLDIREEYALMGESFYE